MKLLTKDLEKKLINAIPDCPTNKPWLKLFNPAGSQTWLLSEYNSERKEFFGLCDLGLGCPELGYVTLNDLENIRLPLGLKIERDMYWEPEHTLSEYAVIAKDNGSIS